MVASNTKRLVYGTYKLPKDYSKFSNILYACLNLGIEWLDTAPIYNKRISESWISDWQQQSNYKFKVATKAGKFYGIDGRLHVSNALKDIVKSVEESLERLKKNRLELLFLHDYEQGKTKEEIEMVVKRLIEDGLVERVGLSNFPVSLSEYLINQSYVSCLQVNYSASDKERQVSLAVKSGIECWLYRPFKRGEGIRKDNERAEKVAGNLLKEYPDCRIIFGASEPSQIEWLKEIK